MLPYIEITTIDLGFITIHFWGLMVSLGFVAGMSLSYFLAKRKGINTEHIFNLAFWILFCAMIGARIFHVLFYQLGFYMENPLEIFKIWQGGLSVFGGFFGSLLAYWIYVIKHKLNFWQLADIFMFSLPLGLAIGRLGCAFIHDHPGIKSDFLLAINYPGGSRHDLGFYLILTNLFIFIVFVLLARKRRSKAYISPAGFYVASYILLYGIIRFFLDFLRAWDLPVTDQRYFYLTLAQYSSVLFIIFSIVIYKKLKVFKS